MCGIFTHDIYSKIFKWTTDKHINIMPSERSQSKKQKSILYDSIYMQYAMSRIGKSIETG